MNLPSGWELIIILVIIVLLVGVGRISKIGGELGKGISAFREGIKGDSEKKAKEDDKKDTPEGQP